MTEDGNMTAEPTTRQDWFICVSLLALASCGLLFPLCVTTFSPKRGSVDLSVAGWVALFLMIIAIALPMVAADMVRESSLKMNGTAEDKDFCRQYLSSWRWMDFLFSFFCYFILIKPNSALGKYVRSLKPRLDPALAIKFNYAQLPLGVLMALGWFLSFYALYLLFPILLLGLYLHSTVAINIVADRDGKAARLFFPFVKPQPFYRVIYLKHLIRSREQTTSPNSNGPR